MGRLRESSKPAAIMVHSRAESQLLWSARVAAGGVIESGHEFHEAGFAEFVAREGC
jgi:hypothetical protein